MFPGPCAAFGCTKEHKGPGMFSHVCDVEGRKDLWVNWGSEQQKEQRCKVTYHTYLASGGRLSYTPSVERVVG